MGAYDDVPPDYRVCFQNYDAGGIPPDIVSKVTDGINSWKPLLSDNGKTLNLTYVTATESQPCDPGTGTLKVTLAPGNTFQAENVGATGVGIHSGVQGTITLNLDLTCPR
jgi:hypothetical protein